jgi:hypothetical protein
MDGTNQYVSVPDNSDWHFGSGDGTIHFWVRFDAVNRSNALFGQFVDSSNFVACYHIGTASAFYFYIVVNGAIQIRLISTWQPAVDTFYHIAIAKEGSNLRVFIDGTLQDSGTLLNWPDIAADLTIGNSGSITYLDGKIDEFAVYKGEALYVDDFTVPASVTPTSESITTAGNNSISLSNIETPEDSQVDLVEIWRTVASGGIYFRAGTVAAGTATYTDSVADEDLESLELPTDNLKPYSWFDDVVYNNASAFWITRTQEGEKGRVYYSPIGRCEAVEGFINIASDEDGCQKLFTYMGQLGVLTKRGAYQILGQNPYTARKFSGVPGTTAPHTAIMTPYGLFYEAADGVRSLRGTLAELVATEAVARIYRGESAAGLTSFFGIVATYTRNEYIVSDTEQTLAVNVKSGAWRDLGVGCNALYYDPINDVIGAVILDDLLDFEKEGELLDYDTNIPISWEPPSVKLNKDQKVLLKHVHIDIDTSSEQITVTLLLDNDTVALGKCATSSRDTVTFNVMRMGQIVGVRLTGDIDEVVELYGIAYEIEDKEE